jgi:hypothetical protein
VPFFPQIGKNALKSPSQAPFLVESRNNYADVQGKGEDIIGCRLGQNASLFGGMM